MLKLFLSISLLFIKQVFSQNNLFSPHPTPEGTRFSFSIENAIQVKPNQYNFLRDLKINSVSLTGSFNNWNKDIHKMIFDSALNFWSFEIRLNPGVEYHYKFVINDTIWITDPNAPDITEDEWQNGIIIPVDYNSPYVINVDPPNGKRITKIKPFKCKLISPFGNIDKTTVKCFINESEVEYEFLDNTNELFIKLPENLKEGEHRVLIQFGDDKGNFNSGFLSKFFLDRYKANIKTPDFYNSAIVYEIFIRKFFDSDGDGIGDFKGLTSKLDYLQSLGVNALWLMPFNESSKDHGYNVIDYYKIEQDYGTFEDYFYFLKECKKRNIKVIKDIVINHCDTSFIYFRDARNNPSSRFSNWFLFIDSLNSDWKHFGIEKDMPKFNFENKEVQDYFIEFIKFYMDPNKDGKFDDGIDGIRCDAAKEIPHSFWYRLRKELKIIRPDFLILGEVWDGANYLIPFFEDEFDMLFDYPLYYAFRDFFMSGNSSAIFNTLQQEKEIYPSNFQMLRFLSNHDNHRALSFFELDTLKYLQALAILLTLPGTPMIYYGDDIGLTGKTPPENVRQNFNWNAVQNNLFVEYHKHLIRIRRQYKALQEPFDSKRRNSLVNIETENEYIFSYLRKTKNETILVVVNNSNKLFKNLSLRNLSLTNSKGLVIFALNDYLKGIKSNYFMNLNSLHIMPREVLIIKLLPKFTS